MKEIFLASKVFIDFDRADCTDWLCGVRVTNECYNALKANGYTLTPEEVKVVVKHFGLNGTSRSKIYGGTDWFGYKELMKSLGWSLPKSWEVRRWADEPQKRYYLPDGFYLAYYAGR